MSQHRLIYRNWIADLGRDPDRSSRITTLPDCGTETQVVGEAVEEALAELTEDEREFIERYYYMGQTFVDISELSGRSVNRLETLHRRALAKLKRRLAPLADHLYGVEKKAGPECPICQSADRDAVDRIIRGKPESEPWGTTLSRIRREFGLTVKSPQTLIGHMRYH
jgi:hypothetical protein